MRICLIGFRVAYSLGQAICGRVIDRIGTKRGLTISVLWYSIVSIVTSLASGFYSFAAFRFCSERESRQLARRNQSSFGMVSEGRTRTGNGAL